MSDRLDDILAEVVRKNVADEHESMIISGAMRFLAEEMQMNPSLMKEFRIRVGRIIADDFYDLFE